MLRKFPKSRLICRIDMSGFLAIMFALVFLFLGSTGPIVCGTSSDLPIARSATLQPRANREDAVFIAVTRDGNVFFDTDKTPYDQLHARIRDRMIRGAEPKIYIRADARVKYRHVADVVNVVRESGIQNIAFLTEQPGSAN